MSRCFSDFCVDVCRCHARGCHAQFYVSIIANVLKGLQFIIKIMFLVMVMVFLSEVVKIEGKSKTKYCSTVFIFTIS